MNPPGPAAVIAVDVEVRWALLELNARYGSLLDDGPLEAWPELFTDDAVYRVVSVDDHRRGLPLGVIRCESRDMLRDRVRAVLETAMYVPRATRHVIGLPLITGVDGDTLLATTPYVVVEAMADEPAQLLSMGRYLDRVVPIDHGLLLAERVCVFDNALVPTSIVAPL